METTVTRIQISRTFPASPEQVFAACSDPTALARWFAPNYEMYPDVDLVPVVGGTYRAEMRHQGGAVHTAYGAFVEVDPPRRLSFTWNWQDEEMAAMGETLVTIEIEALADGVVLTLTHEGFPNEEVADKHQEGWTGCLARLAETFSRSVTHHLSTVLALHARLYFNALAGISSEHLRQRPNDRTNSMLWIAGHLAHTRGMIAQMLGQPADVDLALFGESINDAHDYPSMEEIEAGFRTASTAIRTGLLSVSPDALMAPHAYPRPIPLNDQTLGGMLDFLVDHESYHLGQLGLLRKFHGYEAMSYDTASPGRETYGGRFVWYDLMTSDVKGSIKFYRAVVGWGTDQWTGGDGDKPPYIMWTNDATPIGGVMPLSDTENASPRWIFYVGTPDVDATVAQAQDLGASLLHPPEEIPTVGRFAVLADPLGAPFAVFTPLNEAPGHDGTPTVGEFSWHELATTDDEVTYPFYRTLFGWQGAGEHSMGASTYRMIGRKGVPLGGIFTVAEDSPSAWLLYIRVDDLEKAIAAVAVHSGEVVGEPVEVPGGDLIVRCVDPYGAPFALHATRSQ